MPFMHENDKTSLNGVGNIKFLLFELNIAMSILLQGIFYGGSYLYGGYLPTSLIVNMWIYTAH
jgi:hypothetical protein